MSATEIIVAHKNLSNNGNDRFTFSVGEWDLGKRISNLRQGICQFTTPVLKTGNEISQCLLVYLFCISWYQFLGLSVLLHLSYHINGYKRFPDIEPEFSTMTCRYSFIGIIVAGCNDLSLFKAEPVK